jgi:SNF2 family DNA or RNA helicase
MIRKESDFSSEKFSLWKQQQQDGRFVYVTALEASAYTSTNINSSYRNAVNGSKRLTRPSDPRGGIIADDMGLGKTLVVLSHIVGTKQLGSGIMEASRSSVSSLETDVTLVPIKATLIVVPLSCE